MRKILIFSLFSILSLLSIATNLFSQGQLQITCKPGLRIYIDNNFIGVSTSDEDGKLIDNLSEGSHSVRIEKIGYSPKEIFVNIENKKIIEIKIGELSIENDNIDSEKQESISERNIVKLRSEYKGVGIKEWKSIAANYGFYDKLYNDKPKTFKNEFEEKTINGDQVVIDHATGLMWHQNGSPKKMRVTEAAGWVVLNCEGYAEYSDWRLPTLEEAASLFEDHEENGLNISKLFSPVQKVIWTNDPPGVPLRIYVHFQGGSWGWPMSGWAECYVRPVRSIY